NVSDRWELVGNRFAIPVGTRKIRFRFEGVQQTGPATDSYLDNAFLFIRPETFAPDQGDRNFLADDAAQSPLVHIALRSPDLYADWERDKPHLIRWETFNNASDLLVRIDLYQDTANGPQFLLNISPGAVDSGQYSWIPQTNSIAYGTHGLRIYVSLAGNLAVNDISAEPFSVPGNTNTHYVNDRAATNDQYTSAIGSNRNTGRLANSPKPLINNLLRLYTLGSGDTLYVDTGSYSEFVPVVLSGTVGIGDDEGFTMQGPTAIGKTASVSFANSLTVAPILDLNDADLMTI